MKHLLFSLNLLLLNSCLIASYPMGKITLAVTDEEGKPLTGIEAGTSWSRNTTSNPFDGQTGTGQDAMVDKDGKATFSDSAHRRVGYGADAPGYYKSRGQYEFIRPKHGKWQPWNPTVTLRVRKIGEPIAMYAKNYPRVNLPAPELSYDLIKGDFMPPHGKGETADCTLTYTVSEEGTADTLDYRLDQKLTLTFPGDFNGVTPIPDNMIIKESDFKLPRRAPESGYDSPTLSVTQLVTFIKVPRNINPYEQSRRETTTRVPDCENVFFRIRSEKNPDGTFKSAHYGKLRGPLTIERSPEKDKEGNRKIFLRNFSHYVNPTRNDLNMEYDAMHNFNLSYPREPSSTGWWIRKYGDYERPVREP